MVYTSNMAPITLSMRRTVFGGGVVNRSDRRSPSQVTARHFSASLYGIIVIFLLVLGGCQGKPAKQTTTDGEQLVWDDLNINQRKRHMRQAVLSVAV
jgi:hypothetical protein